MSSIQLNFKKTFENPSEKSMATEQASPKLTTNDPSSLPRFDRLQEGEFSVEAADIVRLIMGFLTAQGLHESARILRKESGIGFVNGMIRRSTVASAIRRGDWGSVIRATSLLGDDIEGIHEEENKQKQNKHEYGAGRISSEISEQIILELAEEDKNLNLAYSLLKVHRDVLDRIIEDEESDIVWQDQDQRKESGSLKSSTRISKARSLEQKLAEIAANPIKFGNNAEERYVALYGTHRSKQERREALAQMVESEKEIPLNRLPILIQQAMKWQSHTGQLPWVKEVYHDNDSKRNTNLKTRRKRKRYDLVMGKVSGQRKVAVGDRFSNDESIEEDNGEILTGIPQDTFSKVKFGKTAVCESALFFSRGLITGSSDSLIEIWDAKCSYKDLNTVDYIYQKDHVMGHTDSPVLCLALSNDEEILVSGDSNGKVKVWKLSTGKCLRQYQAHDTSVTALALTRDATRILTGCASGICREFGIVTQTVLQVYEGHTSYIHACKYVLDWKFAEDKNPQTAMPERWVLTASADGTVRQWKNGLMTRILQPPSEYLKPSKCIGNSFSLVVDPNLIRSESPAIHSIIQVPGEESRMLMVPRSTMAFLTNLEGSVLQAYSSENSEAFFLAASITTSLVYLASSTGNCLVFSLRSGKLLQSIHNFALDSTSKTNNNHRVSEITGMIHHSFEPSTLAAYSNDKTQKKGILTIWK